MVNTKKKQTFLFIELNKKKIILISLNISEDHPANVNLLRPYVLVYKNYYNGTKKSVLLSSTVNMYICNSVEQKITYRKREIF